jgi:hypothetical protein
MVLKTDMKKWLLKFQLEKVNRYTKFSFKPSLGFRL